MRGRDSAAPMARGEPQWSAFNSRAVVGSFLAIVLLINARILLSGGVPVHGDLTYPWRIDNYIDNYLYLFNDAGSIPNIESIDRVFLLFPAWFARLVGQGTGLVHKLVFLVLPLVSLLSVSALLRFVVGRVNPVYVRPTVLIPPSLLYALSPWVLEELQAPLFWMAYALTPLLILLTFRIFESPAVDGAIALSLVLFFVASTPQYFAYSLLILLVIGVVELIHRVRTQGGLRVAASPLARPVLVLVLASLILNFYWIYPTARVVLAGGSVSPGYQVERATTRMFSAEASPLNVARGYDQWVYWYEHDPSLGIVFSRPYVVVTLLPALLALAAVISREGRRSRHFLILGGLAAGFGLVALGTRTPILNWLVFDAPLVSRVGWIFRVPGKLSYMLWPFYCVGLALILGRALARKNTATRIGVLLVAGLGLSILILPKTIAYFYHYYVPIPQPPEYAQLERFLDEQPGEYRVLYLAPYDGAFGRNRLKFETSFTWNPGRVAAATPVISSSRPAIGYYHLTYRDWQTSLYPLVYPALPRDMGSRYLSKVGVRFLVYHDDIVGNEAQGRVDLSRLHRTDLEWVASFGFIHVFENPEVLPVIRASGNGGTAGSLLVQRIDPATYEVEASGAPSVRSLVMGQPFDSLWVLRAGDAVVAPRKASSLTMRFDLPPGDFREGTIEYYPQRYYRVGRTVSLVGLVIVSLGLLLARVGRAHTGPDQVSSAVSNAGAGRVE